MQSLFIINQTNEICLEKHWSKVTPKAVCEGFFDVRAKNNSCKDTIPVIETPNETLIYISKNNLFFLAVCPAEIPPLLVIEFLNCVTDTIIDYFGAVNESVIRDNSVSIYEILDEMLDGGFPLTTEANILKEIVYPPNLLKMLTDAVTGKNSSVSTTLPTCQLSNVRWRRNDVKYTNNEAYFDVIEEISAIIDRSGNIVSKDVNGSIECFVKLSGMPDLSLSFTNHRLIDEASLHPCVRFLRWKRERILSFVPPDGRFCLFTYHIGSLNTLSLPVSIRHNISLREQGSHFDIILTPKTMGKPLDFVKLTAQMPPSVLNVNATPSAGRVSFDIASKLFEWDIGRIEAKHPNPSLKGTVTLAKDLTTPPEPPSLMINFTVPQHAVSGLKIARVDLFVEKYKPFKGVKYITKTKQFEVRT